MVILADPLSGISLSHLLCYKGMSFVRNMFVPCLWLLHSLSPGQLLAEERWVVKEMSMSTCLLEEKTWRPLAFWKGYNYHWSATWQLARLWVPKQLDHSWRRDIHVPLPFVPLSDLIHEPLKGWLGKEAEGLPQDPHLVPLIIETLVHKDTFGWALPPTLRPF